MNLAYIVTVGNATYQKTSVHYASSPRVAVSRALDIAVRPLRSTVSHSSMANASVCASVKSGVFNVKCAVSDPLNAQPIFDRWVDAGAREKAIGQQARAYAKSVAV